MELRVLKYFLTVAREENITRAAEILHITQPTLSRQLMQLEDELDAKLFIRGKTHITLTDEGMLLRKRAEEIIDLAHKTKKEFQKKESIVGEIYIGAAETYATNFLAQVISDMKKNYPLVTYNIYSGNADDIKERIDKGLIDIGLLSEPVQIDKYDYLRLPFQQSWGILMNSDDPLASKEYIRPEDLKGASILCSSRTVVQNQIIQWLGKYKKNVHIIADYNLIYNAAILTQQGIGYTICLEHLIPYNEQMGIIFKPFYPKMETGTVLIWKKNQIFSPTTSKFLEQLKKNYEQL